MPPVPSGDPAQVAVEVVQLTADFPPATTVSVVTVNRNHREGLQRTIDSVAAQTYPHVEWILVDGASDDGSAELARQLSSSMNATLISEPDHGIYDAMNKGLAASSGDVVVFLNSGDQFTHCEVLTSATQRLTRSGSAWGYGGIRLLTTDGVAHQAYFLAPFRMDLLAAGVRTVPHQATFMRRTLLESLGGFDTEFGIAADQELLYRAALLETPDVWIELMADFESGGAGSSRAAHSFPRDMGRARAHSGVPLGGNRVTDVLATWTAVGVQSGLTWQSRLRRRLRSRTTS